MLCEPYGTIIAALPIIDCFIFFVLFIASIFELFRQGDACTLKCSLYFHSTTNKDTMSNMLKKLFIYIFWTTNWNSLKSNLWEFKELSIRYFPKHRTTDPPIERNVNLLLLSGFSLHWKLNTRSSRDDPDDKWQQWRERQHSEKNRPFTDVIRTLPCIFCRRYDFNAT